MRKRRMILEAATEVFLAGGFLGTNMEEIATRSEVSKQTVYKHFGSKEELFVEIVTSMSTSAGDAVLGQLRPLGDEQDVAEFLEDYGQRQLTAVLTPRLMRLRRLVIGEVGRFPELARALHDSGPRRAIAALATTFRDFADRGLLVLDDPWAAASAFNWLIMAAPLNEAMLLGDEAIPSPEALRRHAAEGVRIFLAAYGAR